MIETNTIPREWFGGTGVSLKFLPHFKSRLAHHQLRTWLLEFSHSYRAPWYHQSFIYSPTDSLVISIKKQYQNLHEILHWNSSDMFRCYSYTIIREHINLCLLKLQLLKQSIKIHRCVVNMVMVEIFSDCTRVHLYLYLLPSYR